MIKKQVIFNVGGALSSYLEFDNNKVIVDLGKSDEFNPVLDFLLPLAKRRNFEVASNTNKYWLEQTFLSHLDNDHISTIDEFDKYFNPRYLTVPCEHPKQNGLFNIIKNFFIKTDEENSNIKKILELMHKRLPGHGGGTQEDMDTPLVVYPNCQKNIEMYHIPAGICDNKEELKKHYSNNLSLVLFININDHIVFMPGDIMKEGMEYLITNNKQLKTNLQTIGVDFLVAPHHGLSTSFPEILFSTMKNNRTNGLNIISEKIRKKDSDESRSEVDSRYYDDKHSAGNNNIDAQKGIKTSGGHIIIDYSGSSPVIKIIGNDEKEKLINEFIET